MLKLLAALLDSEGVEYTRTTRDGVDVLKNGNITLSVVVEVHDAITGAHELVSADLNSILDAMTRLTHCPGDGD